MNIYNFFLRSTALMAAVATLACCGKQTKEAFPVPEKPILEMDYSAEKTTFEVWAPTAEKAVVRLYDGNKMVEEIEMKSSNDGLWTATAKGDKKGLYYAFQVTVDGKPLKETAGIFARALNVNGDRGAIIDLNDTNPEGWAEDKTPVVPSSEIIIYEMHYRDMTAHASAGSSYPGKYLGMAEHGTRSKEGLATGIDHLVEMGITHLHLLPTADFGSIDESKPTDQYNWGYEPKNYSAPEGTYSTNPADPEARIRELKTLVQTLHKAGINVVLDVVYNHTTSTENCGFELTVPGYFYRMREDGSFADGSGCGNETASDKPMMQKYIVESLEYWVKEFHIDGFRFDLMAIHDIETMNLIRTRLEAIKPSI